MFNFELTFEQTPIRYLNADSFLSQFVLIVDYTTKQIIPIENVLSDDWQSLRDAIFNLSEKYKTLDSFMIHLRSLTGKDDNEKAKNIETFWKNLIRKITNLEEYHVKTKDIEVIDFCQPSFPGYKFKIVDLANAIGNTTHFPAWMEFVTRVDPKIREYFLAWIWSIYVKDGTRLLCWLNGAGNDGKSVIAGILSEMLNPLAHSVNNWNSSDKFLSANLIGKRLIYLPDQDNVNLIEDPLIKSITGGDIISVERKFAQQKSMVIPAKIMVSSNKIPKIGDSNASETRLLVVKIEQPNAISKNVEIWKAELRDQFPNFLKYCQTLYHGFVGAKGKLEIPQQINKTYVENSLSYSAQVQIEFMEEKLSFKAGARVPCQEVNDKFSEFCSFRNIQQSEVKNLFNSLKLKIQEKGVNSKKSRFYGNKVIFGFEGVELK